MRELNQTSGDLNADKRAAYARMLAEAGDFPAAADLMEQALALAPLWAAGWFQLGEYQEKAGSKPEAESAFSNALHLAPADMLGAGLKLAYLRGTAVDVPAAHYVEALFDDYAARFDKALLEKLDYRVPSLLAAKLEKYAPARQFSSAVDLGCGTGLMAQALVTKAHSTVGIDLSEAMLAEAHGKGLYSRLVKADVVEGLEACGAADLILAADVYMYLRSLRPVTATVAKKLVDDGVYGFSVELHDGDEDCVLRPSLRHAHSRSHVNALLEANGFRIVDQSVENIRRDGSETLRGLITLAVRHGRH